MFVKILILCRNKMWFLCERIVVCLYARVNDRWEDADRFLCEKIVICLYAKEESDREDAEIGKIVDG